MNNVAKNEKKKKTRKDLSSMNVQRRDHFRIVRGLNDHDSLISDVDFGNNRIATEEKDVKGWALDHDLRIIAALNPPDHTSNVARQRTHHCLV